MNIFGFIGISLVVVVLLNRRVFPDWKLIGQLIFSVLIVSVLSYLGYLGFLIFSMPDVMDKAVLSVLSLITIISSIFALLEFFTIINVSFRKKWAGLPKVQGGYLPMVSIHVPTSTEPPEVVKETLDSINKLNYKDFEVLVIDSNTAVESFWKPVEEHCKKLGPKFKFFHIPELPGAKAGALNLAITKTDPRVEVVAVVDADYKVNSNFLEDLTPYFKDPKIALIQTPQYYRGFERGGYMESLFWEYRYFFSFIMPSCNEFNAAAFMGTMGLIRKNVLVDIEKWNEWCVTEDSEVGLRIHQNKLKTIYIDRPYGEGFMPFEFRDYKKQRARWSFGNMQIILRNFWQLLPIPFVSNLTWYQKLSYLSQLTVWFNNILLSSMILIAFGSANLLGIDLPDIFYVIGSVPLIAFLASKACIFLALSRKDHIPLSRALKSLFINLSLTWIMAASWLNCLLNSHGSFWRTSKYPHKLEIKDQISTIKWEFIFFTVSSYLGILLLINGSYFLGGMLSIQALFLYFPSFVAILRHK